MGYNYAMRMLLTTLLLLALPLITFAQDCACAKAEPACASPAQLAADRAGVCIIRLSACLSAPAPACLRHRCAPTYYPCAPCLPVRCVAHRPLACLELCATAACPPRACHKPVVTLLVEDPCPLDVVLTGTPDVIEHQCAGGADGR
jgi:hypothetical protein